MKSINRIGLLSSVLIAASLLAACGGTAPGAANSTQGPKIQPNVVAFTGIVESISGGEWTVSGQNIILAPQASLDPGIAVGDEVKVEANVSAEGAVIALKVESSGHDEVVSTPSAEVGSTPDPVGTASPEASSPPGPGSTAPAPRPQTGVAHENEVFGAVQAITGTTVTVGGVTYSLSSSTEFKDVVGVGDQVKLHVTVNADGSLTIRELEKSTASLDDNSSLNGSDDGPNHDLNDDHSNGNSNDDSNDNDDDHGGSSGNSGSGGDD